MKVEIDSKTQELVIRIPMERAVLPSHSGKTRIVASTHGPARSGVMYDDLPVTVSLNAYIKNLPGGKIGKKSKKQR